MIHCRPGIAEFPMIVVWERVCLLEREILIKYWVIKRQSTVLLPDRPSAERRDLKAKDKMAASRNSNDGAGMVESSFIELTVGARVGWHVMVFREETERAHVLISARGLGMALETDSAGRRSNDVFEEIGRVRHDDEPCGVEGIE